MKLHIRKIFLLLNISVVLSEGSEKSSSYESLDIITRFMGFGNSSNPIIAHENKGKYLGDSNFIKKCFEGRGILERKLECIDRFIEILYYRHQNLFFLDSKHDKNSESIKIEIRLYRLFKECMYLVNPIFYSPYKRSFENCNFAHCYNIIKRCLCPLNFVDEYVTFVKLCARQSSTTICGHIFVSEQKSLVKLPLRCNERVNMCIPDFIHQTQYILSITLFQRIELIQLFFDEYYRECQSTENIVLVDRLIAIYTRVFLSKKKNSNEITAFVIRLIYSELYFREINAKIISNIIKLLADYEKDCNNRIVRFHLKLAFCNDE